MSTLKKFEIPIYFGNLWVLISDDFIKSAKDLMGMDIRLNANDSLGISMRKTEDGIFTYCLMLKSHKIDSIDVLAHEALHIVNYICEDVGMHLSVLNDEPQAYLLGWVMRQIQDTINQHKIDEK